VVMDAQRAFVDAAGSLARAYGFDDLRPSVDALARLQRYLTSCDADTHVVSCGRNIDSGSSRTALRHAGGSDSL
jgi:hypothetical protein